MIDSTGCAGLDEVLRGGLPAGQLYLLEGSAGAGKTTLGLQFLLKGVELGESVLWCTLAETEAQLRATAEAHAMDLSGVQIVNLAQVEAADEPHAEGDYSFFSPSDVELDLVVKHIIDTVDRIRPRRVVFDPFSDVRLLARDPLRFRRQLLRLRDHFMALGATVLLIQESGLGEEQDAAGEGVVNGVLALYQHAPDFGKQRRRLRVHKLRAVAFREGFHDLAIQTGGIVVYPRLIANQHDAGDEAIKLRSGSPSVDEMLGGGVDAGTSLLVTGPAGIGKSTLCMQFGNACAESGTHAAFFMFDETRRAFLARADALGMRTREFVQAGALQLRQVDPAEFSPGEFAQLIRDAVERDGARLIVIDSLNGYLAGMPDERHLAMHMHELLAYLANRNVATLLTLNQQGIVGEQSGSSVDVAYLTDSTVLARYFEVAGEIRRAFAVTKRRIGPHDPRIREMRIGTGGIELLGTLSDVSGALTGLPEARSVARGE